MRWFNRIPVSDHVRRAARNGSITDFGAEHEPTPQRSFLVTVRGLSMSPHLKPGDKVVVKRSRRLRRGDIVVLDARYVANQETANSRTENAKLVIKRVAAVAGDPVPACCGEEDLPNLPAVVRRRELVVLGDNPLMSTDSRVWGPVPVEAVVGRARRTPNRLKAAQYLRLLMCGLPNIPLRAVRAKALTTATHGSGGHDAHNSDSRGPLA